MHEPTIHTPHLAAAAHLILLGHTLIGQEPHPYRKGGIRFLFPRDARPDLDVWYETVDKIRRYSIPAVPTTRTEGEQNHVPAGQQSR
jgi:hypothetical protein